MFGGKHKEPTNANFVHQAEIWKKHCGKERKAVKKWPQNWMFIKDSCHELEDKFKEMREKDSQNIEKATLPSEMVPRPSTPIDTYIKIGETSRFPKTTSGQIGWRSGRPECNLEIYGRWTKPKQVIYKQFEWPLEACL